MLPTGINLCIILVLRFPNNFFFSLRRITQYEICLTTSNFLFEPWSCLWHCLIFSPSPQYFLLVWQLSILCRNSNEATGAAVKLLLPATRTIKNQLSRAKKIFLEARCRSNGKINTAYNSIGKRIYKSLFLLHSS